MPSMLTDIEITDIMIFCYSVRITVYNNKYIVVCEIQLYVSRLQMKPTVYKCFPYNTSNSILATCVIIVI